MSNKIEHDDDETEEIASVQPALDAEAIVFAGKAKLRKVISIGISLLLGSVAAMATSFAMSAVQSRAPVEITGIVTPTPAAESGIQPRPEGLQAPQQIFVQPQETEADRIIMERIMQLTTAVDNLASEVHLSSGSQAPPASEPVVVPGPAHTVFEPIPTPAPTLSIWEDGGGCWTPATATSSDGLAYMATAAGRRSRTRITWLCAAAGTGLCGAVITRRRGRW